MRIKTLKYGVLVLGILAVAATAEAQETRNVGLTMGGSGIGVLFEAGDRVAIRPELTFNRVTSESPLATDSPHTATSISPGISLLFQLVSWDDTRVYVAPRWVYQRATTSSANDEADVAHTFSASLGAQHRMGRFGVFGEAGITHGRSDNQQGAATFKTRSWSTRSTVGAILFF